MAYVERFLPKCTSLLHIKQLQAHLIATGLFNSYINRSRLLDFCATSSSGSFPYASFIFNNLPQPSANDWNAIIRGLAQSHEPINAVISYVSMQRASCKPDALTCSFVLKACARALAIMETKQVHSHVVKFGVKSDVLLQTTLLDVYAKCSDLDCARMVFDEMLVTDVASWNALIAGLAQGNRPNEALRVFKEMKESSKVHPNEVTVLGALSACSQLGAIKEGEEIYNYIRSCNLDANVTVCNAMIDMFAKCGFVEKAYTVFSRMECKKDIVTWNTMIMAFGMHGEGTKALDIFEEMRKSGMVADPVTFLAALCACNHAGMVSEGLRLFELMDEIGVYKNVKHYGSTVDLLARAGRLEEAYNIIESMSALPDVVLWQTLLGASKTHGNVEMAERASRKLVEIGSNHCGDFVLLSNLYAAHKRWNDVERVREAMRNRRTVKKVPGFSYTEVDGVIYKFINGDQCHPKLKEIHQKLDEIEVKIREYGYMPETNYVLHDIGEEEKENALSYHSEKLAVAFGLISTSSESTISVNKNLRICGDCHLMIKLISKIYHREIVVRDRTRFHKFTEGSCSCKDYW